jgi:restriction system protein
MSLVSDYQRLMQPLEDADVLACVQAPDGAAKPIIEEVSLVSMMNAAHTGLADELLARIHAQCPEFFEHLVIDVLLAMGYGNRGHDMAQCLGRTGDGGVDGVIKLDELGLDQVCIQAKRLRPGNPVPISEVRDFAGSLEARHAAKGVFVSTSHFSPGAAEFCAKLSRKVVLIDGHRLTDLMIRHNIGVRIKDTYQFKRIDTSYFSATPSISTAETISASIQPRR